jgi:hypothetical protein
MAITLDKIDSGLHSIAVTDGGGSLTIDDGGGSITVDGSLTTTLNAEIAEDASVGDAHVVNLMGLVRQDTLATDTSADGDASYAKTSALGELYVKDSQMSAVISGSELQVDIVAELPAGTNNIGDVDIVTMPGIYVEDAASAGGENLMLIGGYRQDTPGSSVSADGDIQGFLFNGSGELYVTNDNSIINSSVLVTAVSVDDTVGGINLIATELANRKEITVQNLGSNDVFIKAGTGVTTANGFELAKGSSASFAWGPSIDLYAITASGSSDIRVVEAA